MSEQSQQSQQPEQQLVQPTATDTTDTTVATPVTRASLVQGAQEAAVSSENSNKDQGEGEQDVTGEEVPDATDFSSEVQDQLKSPPSTPPAEDFEAGVLTQLDSLYRTALRLTNNRQEAEDLVQETMLKAFRFSHTYQPGTNLRAWLFRILNTSAINRYRKQATHPTPSPLPEGEEFYLYNQIRDLNGQELSSGAEEEVLSRYLDEDVYKALYDLPPNFRMAVILADIEGLSYKEIAEVLQIPIGTVMSRISRARRQLQRSLWQYAQDRGYVKPQVSNS